jgi:hypothetical protein
MASSPDDKAQPEATAGGSPLPGNEGAVRDALGGLVRAMLGRGKHQVERAAAEGRNRLELRTLRKDRDQMYQKLGREVRRLQEGGELSHPGVARGVARLSELDEKIRALEGVVGAEAGAEEPSGAEGSGAEGEGSP